MRAAVENGIRNPKQPRTWQGGPPQMKSTSPGRGSASTSAVGSAALSAAASGEASQSSTAPDLAIAAWRSTLQLLQKVAARG